MKPFVFLTKEARISLTFTRGPTSFLFGAVAFEGDIFLQVRSFKYEALPSGTGFLSQYVTLGAFISRFFGHVFGRSFLK